MSKKSFHNFNDSLYRVQILDHYRNPRNFGKLRNATHAAGHKNASCGDAVQMEARIEKGKITAVAFTGHGCAISLAATSMLTEYARGKTLAAIKKLKLSSIEEMLKTKISPARTRCALLGAETAANLAPIDN